MSNDNLNKRKQWTHQSFEKDDLSEIGLFFKIFYLGMGEYGSMGYFDWKISRNYVQPGIINLIKDNGKIVSTASLTPKQLIFKNQLIDIAEIGDVYTDTEYQRQGMFSLLGNETRKESESRDLNFIYGLPNEAALPGWIKNKFNIIENIQLISFIFPLNIQRRIQSKAHWTISRLIGSILSMLLFSYYKFKKLLDRIDRSILVKELHECPNDWDDFWDKANKPYDFIINRDKNSILWRYFDNPNKYTVIGLYRKNKLLGYLVYRIINDEYIKNTVIADFLTLPGYEYALSSGLNRIIEESFETGVDNITLWCIEDSKFSEIFNKKGFFKRVKVPVIYYQNSFSEKVIQSRSFHFTIGDSDNI